MRQPVFCDDPMLAILDHSFSYAISDVVATFFDPRKRIFLGYLACTMIIALFYWVVMCRRGLFDSVKSLFSRKVWNSNSAKADYKMLIINKLFMLLVSPILLSQLAMATAIFFSLYDFFPSRPQVPDSWSVLSISIIFTVFYFLLDDFARFYVHRLMHRWPILWAFHKVHHSAQRLTPLTVLRTHPVEMIVYSTRSAFVQAIAIGVFIFFLGDNADLVTIYGAMMFSFVFNVLGSNLRHSHVAIGYWRGFERWLISPAQHHIHHSIAEKHWDKNYGVALSVWDRLFGSFCYSEPKKRLVFGVKGIKMHSLHSIYIEPMLEGTGLIKQFFVRCHKKIHSLYCRYSKVVIL